MTSNRPDASDNGPAGVGTPQMLAVSGALRWARPDLTAGIAGHVAGSVPSGTELWLAASAWLVHGSAVTGDGRPRAAGVLRQALAPGAGVDLDSEQALRLWAEVAAVSQDNGDSAAARRLAEAVLNASACDPALRLDARLVLVRALLTEEGRHAEISDHLAAAAEDAALIPHGAAAAAVSLTAAAGERAAGRVASAVSRVREGLRLLGVDPEDLRGTPTSWHLADALAGQWLGTLLDCGRTADARQVALRIGGIEAERPVATRQAAQLRLAVARALASDARTTTVALDEAARTAAAADVPKLEAACCVALAELAEQTGRLDEALVAMRTGVAAERRDRERGAELRAVVAHLEEAWRPPAGRPARRRSERAAEARGGSTWPHGAGQPAEVGYPAETASSAADVLLPAEAAAGTSDVRSSAEGTAGSRQQFAAEAAPGKAGRHVAAAAAERPATTGRSAAEARPEAAGGWPEERAQAGAHSGAPGVASWWKSDGSPLGDALAAELSSAGGAAGPDPAVQATDEWLRQTIEEIDRVWATPGGAPSRNGRQRHGPEPETREPAAPPSHRRRADAEPEDDRPTGRRHRAEEGGGLRVAELAERAQQGARHRDPGSGRRATGVDQEAPGGSRRPEEAREAVGRRRRSAEGGPGAGGEPAAEAAAGVPDAAPAEEGAPVTRPPTLEEETAHLGLGDLLAGALAAYRGL